MKRSLIFALLRLRARRARYNDMAPGQEALIGDSAVIALARRLRELQHDAGPVAHFPKQ